MPRRRRRPRKSSAQASPASRPPNQPAKRKQWTNRQMEDAMKAALSGEMSANQAALQYGVPRSTRRDRLSGRVKLVSRARRDEGRRASGDYRQVFVCQWNVIIT